MQRLAGLMIALVSAGFIAYTWHTALSEGEFSVKGSLSFPAILVLGLGLFLFPNYKDERLARGEDISGLFASSMNYLFLTSHSSL
jgi:hypothetical protein